MPRTGVGLAGNRTFAPGTGVTVPGTGELIITCDSDSGQPPATLALSVDLQMYSFPAHVPFACLRGVEHRYRRAFILQSNDIALANNPIPAH